MIEIALSEYGRLANQMLAYSYAASLHQRHPNTRITGAGIPAWNIKLEESSKLSSSYPVIDISNFDPEFVDWCISNQAVSGIRIFSAICNVKALPSPDTANKFFQTNDQPRLIGSKDELLIHLRLLHGVFEGGQHKDYGPLPISFYSQIIEETGKHPIFMGELGNDWYSNELRKSFPNATFLETGTILEDFQTLRNAKNIVLAISTYSWTAAWLSDADQIHLPVFGLFNPAQRNDVDLLPIEDKRYSFYSFPLRKWENSEKDVDTLLEKKKFPKISVTEVRKIRKKSDNKFAPILHWWEKKFLSKSDKSKLYLLYLQGILTVNYFWKKFWINITTVFIIR